MGRDATFYCRDCKVECYLGYGSHGTWLDGVKTVAEFEASDPSTQSIHKNQEMLRMLREHEGHNFVTQSGDWTHMHGTMLCAEFGPMGSCEPLFDTAGWRDDTAPETRT